MLTTNKWVIFKTKHTFNFLLTLATACFTSTFEPENVIKRLSFEKCGSKLSKNDETSSTIPQLIKILKQKALNFTNFYVCI